MKNAYLSLRLSYLKVSIVLLLVVSISGCGLTRRTVAALRSTENFVPLEADKRVMYEPGAEDLAHEVDGSLSEAISTIEREQYRPFPKPIVVYICATAKSFALHTGLPQEVRAAVMIKLFLSAERIKKQDNGSEARALLTHELSHLHLQQQLGVYGFGSHLPAWFREGLAVIISGGAGAEKINDAEATTALLSGKHFKPNTTENFFFPKYGNAFGLEPHMFYRQSALFVAFLKRRDETMFRAFLLMLEDGQSFEKSFNKVYEANIDTMWQQFIAQLKSC